MACLSKGNGVRCIGFTLFVFTLGLFIAYLIFIEDIRRIVLEVRQLILNMKHEHVRKNLFQFHRNFTESRHAASRSLILSLTPCLSTPCWSTPSYAWPVQDAPAGS